MVVRGADGKGEDEGGAESSGVARAYWSRRRVDLGCDRDARTSRADCSGPHRVGSHRLRPDPGQRSSRPAQAALARLHRPRAVRGRGGVVGVRPSSFVHGGRSGASGATSGDTKRGRQPVAPDDDPEFLRSLDTGNAEYERLLRRWEEDLKRREGDLKGDDQTGAETEPRRDDERRRDDDPPAGSRRSDNSSTAVARQQPRRPQALVTHRRTSADR